MGSLLRSADLRVWRARQRAGVLPAALARAPDGSQGDRLCDDTVARERRRRSAVLGPRDLDRLAFLRRAVGGSVCPVVARDRNPRLSLPRGRSASRKPGPLRPALADASPGGVPSPRGAAGDHSPSRPGEDRLLRRHSREHVLTVHLLEELSTPALDSLPRDRTVIILTVSPLEEHGPHLPVGVDAFTARHFAETLGERLVQSRSGWNVVLAPTLHLGTFTFDTVGTIRVRQRVVRDVVIDYGDSLARAGFRHILVANGHGGPGHLVALEEAAAIVSRRRGVTMASLSGHLAWEFLRGRYLPKIEAALGCALTDDERRAFAEDAHAGWWETSLMLLVKPHLVAEAYRRLPPARYSHPQRLVPNYPLRNGGEGYVGHPALADPAFARAGGAVLLDEAMELVTGLLEGRVRPGQARSPFFALPFLRTNFCLTLGGALTGLALVAGWW